MQLYQNNGQSTLSASATAIDTSLFIQPGHGIRYPTITGSDFFYVTLENSAGNLEIVKVTAHTSASTSFTVVRGQQGTTARTWASGDLVELRSTAIELTAFEVDIDDLQATRSIRAGDTYSGVHDFSGATIRYVTKTQGDNNTNGATTAYVDIGLATKASLNSPAFTGTPTAPTPGGTSNDTSIATTAYVTSKALTSVVPVAAGDNGKFLTNNGTVSSWGFAVSSVNGAYGAITGMATLAGAETLTNKVISAFNYIDKTVTNAAATGALSLNMALGDVFNLTLVGATTLSVANMPVLSNETAGFVVKVTQGATAYALTWFGTITWLTSGGIAPSAPAANGTAEYIFTSTTAGNYVGRKGAST